MKLKKGNIEELLDRNKIKDMKKKNKIFEKGFNKTRDFNGKVELTKLKNGRISLYVTDWSKKIDNYIIIFLDIKDNL